MRIRGFCIALVLLTLLPAAHAHTRDEVRGRYALISEWSEGALYLSRPSVSAPYDAGGVRPDALQDALNYINFFRWLAGLEPVGLDEKLTGIAQCGAVLQAANDEVSHDPRRPPDMPPDFFEKAKYAAKSSNIAKLNWMSDGVLRDAVEHFALDGGEANLRALGHRRWLLNPRMALTGLGLASAESGLSYIAMYAHDMQADPGEWEYVAWPGAGAFPAELLAPEIAWSIVLNPEVYAIGDVRVTLVNLETGEVYAFPGDGYFKVDEGNYGAGPCLIFRPDVPEDYRQNQRFRVEVEGLSGPSIRYEVEMIALYPIGPASVEISPRSLEMAAGESAELSAGVFPAWADDLSVVWESTDPSVATVEGGTVTAASAGDCEIHAVAVNGRRDACAVRVR
ncbi:MAG: hypothetical protein GX592_02690 [Clostridiales bacterium]|nr:hypothetical protein [Clostridiales bacterium]